MTTNSPETAEILLFMEEKAAIPFMVMVDMIHATAVPEPTLGDLNVKRR